MERKWWNPLFWFRKRDLSAIASSLLVLVVAFFYDFLVFHTLVELFCVIVGMLLFFFSVCIPTLNRQPLLSFLGAGYFWVALLDLMHTLTFPGMSDTVLESARPAVQYWMAARLLEAAVLAAVPFFLHTRPLAGIVFVVGGIVAIGSHLAISRGVFPPLIVPGEGLTPLKIAGEYTVAGVLVGALLVFCRHRRMLAQPVYALIAVAMGLTAVAELVFTVYEDRHGYTMALGHVLKFLSFWLILAALLHRPKSVQSVPVD